MKQFLFAKSNLTFSALSVAVLLVSGLSSCGTIADALTKGKRPSFILNAPADVVVKLDGKPLDIELELFASTNIANVSNDFSTAAVNIPYKKATTLEVSSARLGKTGTVVLTPERSGPIFWGNLLFAPIVGHIIDGITDNNKVLSPRYIDVNSVLNNIPFKDWPSQAKLKRLEKSKAKKNTTRTVTYK